MEAACPASCAAEALLAEAELADDAVELEDASVRSLSWSAVLGAEEALAAPEPPPTAALLWDWAGGVSSGLGAVGAAVLTWAGSGAELERVWAAEETAVDPEA